MAKKKAYTAKMNQSPAGKIFDVFNYAFMVLLAIVMIIPLAYVIVGSFSSSGMVQMQFGKFTFDAYETIIHSSRTLRSIGNSVIITVCGTLLKISFTTLTAYGLSKSYLPGHKMMIRIVMFFMLFSIGLVPDYIFVANRMRLKDTYWAIWMPGVISAYNLIVMMNAFRALPASIEESACIDGANELQCFIRIVLPMSTASIATFTLFYAVDLWNDYLKATIYLNDADLWPITIWLRQFIVLSQTNIIEEVGDYVSPWMPQEAVKFATIVVSTLPIICVYPFVQRYFTKGVLLGSVKG